MRLRICKHDEPILRQFGVPVTEITADIRQLAADMIETMKAEHGIGLAAQQVGHALQLLVVGGAYHVMTYTGFDVNKALPLVLVNPTVTPANATTLTGNEGCLSFPGQFLSIPRWSSINVEATLLSGETVKFSCSGLLARVIQHEYDHVQGILFTDRLATVKNNS